MRIVSGLLRDRSNIRVNWESLEWQRESAVNTSMISVLLRDRRGVWGEMWNSRTILDFNNLNTFVCAVWCWRAWKEGILARRNEYFLKCPQKKTEPFSDPHFQAHTQFWPIWPMDLIFWVWSCDYNKSTDSPISYSDSVATLRLKKKVQGKRGLKKLCQSPEIIVESTSSSGIIHSPQKV